MKQENIIAIITGPSAVGKTTIAKELLKKLKRFKPGVTYTTRKARKWSTEDKIINYISKKEFRKMIDDDQLIEWAQVYDNFYGTGKKEILKILKKHNVLLNINVQGAKIIKKKFPKSISIFILPEDIENIKKRLYSRPMEESVKKIRFKAAKKEIAESSKFDYEIVNYNNKLERAVNTISKILKYY